MPSLTPPATPASIDSPGMRHAGRELLSLALIDARNRTLHLMTCMAQSNGAGGAGSANGASGMEGGALPAAAGNAGRPLWLAGHIGWFAEFWIGRNTQRALGPACPAQPMRLASITPDADRLWSFEAQAPQAQWAMDLPALIATKGYLLETLESSLALLEKTPETDAALYFFRLALFHEDRCGEQLVALAQALGLPLPMEAPQSVAVREPLALPATRWTLGSPRGGFVFDNEQWAHEVAVPEFEIDAQPVTWAQYVEFVDDGGYDRQDLWQPAGWEWLQDQQQREGRRSPRYVEQIGVARQGSGGAVLQMRFGRPVRMAGNQIATHLAWWEADAWARWAGRRLPTEVEWEIAVHTAVRRGFRWGDVHEWMANTLRPWPGFTAGPWDSYSQPWFGHARVQRGASFATHARLKNPKLRGFAPPECDEGFVGFRSCAI